MEPLTVFKTTVFVVKKKKKKDLKVHYVNFSACPHKKYDQSTVKTGSYDVYWRLLCVLTFF